MKTVHREKMKEKKGQDGSYAYENVHIFLSPCCAFLSALCSGTIDPWGDGITYVLNSEPFSWHPLMCFCADAKYVIQLTAEVYDKCIFTVWNSSDV